MSFIREDLITGEWVLIAPDRSGVPVGWVKKEKKLNSGIARCHFCPENERYISNNVEEIQDRRGEWKARVIMNTFQVIEDGRMGQVANKDIPPPISV